MVNGNAVDDQLVLDLVWKIAEARGLVQTTDDPPTRTIVANRNYIIELMRHCRKAVSEPVP